MEKLQDIKKEELLEMSLKDYFKVFETYLYKEIDLEWLTGFLTDKSFRETKPYMIRRQLIPFDPRFKEIEIVYDENKCVCAVVWDLSISLSQLMDLFGKAFVNYEPYGNSTLYTFVSNNPDIEILKTRLGGFETQESVDKKIEIFNPEFDFLQFDLKNY